MTQQLSCDSSLHIIMARWLRGTRLKVRTGLIGGVAILLLVDILWVGSAGLTRVRSPLTTSYHIINFVFTLQKQFLFTEESYEKPFFTTYFKTSLFSIYLVAFLFWRPWQRQCFQEMCRCTRNGKAATVRDAAPHQATAGESQENDSCDAQAQHRDDHQAINVCLCKYTLGL